MILLWKLPSGYVVLRGQCCIMVRAVRSQLGVCKLTPRDLWSLCFGCQVPSPSALLQTSARVQTGKKDVLMSPPFLLPFGEGLGGGGEARAALSWSSPLLCPPSTVMWVCRRKGGMLYISMFRRTAVVGQRHLNMQLTGWTWASCSLSLLNLLCTGGVKLIRGSECMCRPGHLGRRVGCNWEAVWCNGQCVETGRLDPFPIWPRTLGQSRSLSLASFTGLLTIPAAESCELSWVP